MPQPPSAAPSAAGRAAAAQDRPRCKFHGCTYSGSLENEWHCSLHFKQMQQQRNAAAPHPVPPAPSAPAAMTVPNIEKPGSFSGSPDADSAPSSAPLQPLPQSAHPSDADEGPSDTVLVSQMRAHSQLLGCLKNAISKFRRMLFVMRTTPFSLQLQTPICALIRSF